MEQTQQWTAKKASEHTSYNKDKEHDKPGIFAVFVVLEGEDVGGSHLFGDSFQATTPSLRLEIFVSGACLNISRID